jgi:transcriptional regulator with XRE-family HTH domain
MPSGKQPESGPFARAISAEFRASMARQRVSGPQLAAKASLSPSYLSKRLRDEVAFTANDIESICAALGEDILRIVHAAVRASQPGGEGRPKRSH